MKKRSKSIVSLAVISFLVAVSSYPISAQESSETQSEQKIETKSELVQPYTKESTAPSSEKPEPDTASAEKADSTENADSDAETEPGNGGSGGGGETTRPKGGQEYQARDGGSRLGAGQGTSRTRGVARDLQGRRF